MTVPMPTRPMIASQSTSGALTAEALGFRREPDINGDGCSKTVGGLPIGFRALRGVAELLPVEALQWEVYGGGDRDIAAASQLAYARETGGEVLGAFASNPARDGDELVGCLISWGGYLAGRPRLLSFRIAVHADRRGIGLGAELKKLQAALALARGFPEAVWLVDPLRAANAR